MSAVCDYYPWEGQSKGRYAVIMLSLWEEDPILHLNLPPHFPVIHIQEICHILAYCGKIPLNLIVLQRSKICFQNLHKVVLISFLLLQFFVISVQCVLNVSLGFTASCIASLLRALPFFFPSFCISWYTKHKKDIHTRVWNDCIEPQT